MKASIEDVARQAGVSTATVSRAFSRPDMVSAKTRAKVMEAAQQLDFSVSRMAGILKSGRCPPRGAAGGQQQARLVHLAHHRRPQRSAAIGRLRSGHPTDRRRGRARGVLRRTAGARQRGRGHRLVVRHHPGRNQATQHHADPAHRHQHGLAGVHRLRGHRRQGRHPADTCAI